MTDIHATIPLDALLDPDDADTDHWIGVARDDRTGHYWHSIPNHRLPACITCRRWMTDWSLINRCDTNDTDPVLREGAPEPTIMDVATLPMPEPPNFTTVRIGPVAWVRNDQPNTAGRLSWSGPGGRRTWDELCEISHHNTGHPPVVLQPLIEDDPGLLTDSELDTLDLAARLADQYALIVDYGPSRTADLAEFGHHIHAIQQAVMAQAAARAYPERFRLLGATRLIGTTTHREA
jgi:hypothetical protein